MDVKHVIVGTAAISTRKIRARQALTGTHPDRLKKRNAGITIDLGFAFLNVDGVRLGFVDVPGTNASFVICSPARAASIC